jgi:uncharacterized membrane protein YhiD involved in acid resistance
MDLSWAGAGGGPALADTMLSLLVAFILGQALAWTYYATHSGLSYSRSFVQSLILIAIVVSMVMSTVANSFVTALALFGAMALIRFRNMLKDTRDIAFVFGTLVAGMAAGAGRYTTAILGTVFVCACAAYLHRVNFGAHVSHNAYLEFRVHTASALEREVAAVLGRFCETFTLLSVVRDPESGESFCTFQLLVRRSDAAPALIAELESLPVVRNVGLTLQEQLLEV